jgi:polar amino acid transport system substrate-binding protein
VVLYTNYILLKRSSLVLDFRGLEDARPYRIGVLRGGITGSALDGDAGFSKEEATSFEQNIQKLAAGRIDLMTCERYNGLHLLKTAYPEEAKKIQALYPVISHIAFYLMFAKAAPDTAAKQAAFARGLAHLKSTGRYAELLRLHGYAPEAAATR